MSKLYTKAIHIEEMRLEAVVSLSESDLGVSNIVDVTILTDEGVSENPCWSESSGSHREDGESALSSSELEVENVLDRLHVVFGSSDGEDKVWLSLHGGAVDDVELR